MEFTTERKHWQARKALPLRSEVAQAHSVEDPLEASPLRSKVALADSVEDLRCLFFKKLIKQKTHRQKERRQISLMAVTPTPDFDIES